MIIFLISYRNHMLWPSSELSHQDSSDERAQHMFYALHCCIVALRPRSTSKVILGRSVNLTTLFLGRLRPPKRLTSTSCTNFCQ